MCVEANICRRLPIWITTPVCLMILRAFSGLKQFSVILFSLNATRVQTINNKEFLPLLPWFSFSVFSVSSEYLKPFIVVFITFYGETNWQQTSTPVTIHLHHIIQHRRHVICVYFVSMQSKQMEIANANTILANFGSFHRVKIVGARNTKALWFRLVLSSVERCSIDSVITRKLAMNDNWIEVESAFGSKTETNGDFLLVNSTTYSFELHS